MTNKDFVVKNGLVVTTPALQVNSVFFSNSSQVFANTVFVANGDITANNSNVNSNNIVAKVLEVISVSDTSTNVVANTTQITLANSSTNTVISTVTVAVANSIASVNLTPISVRVGNTNYYLLANTTALYVANSTVNTGITIPSSAQWTGGYFLHANGTWAIPSGTYTGMTRVYQAFTATAGQTTFTVSGGYTVAGIDVYYNGVHLANTEYTQNGSTVVLGVAAALNAVVEVSGWK